MKSMLLDLENIEKVFAMKDGKKARSVKALAGTAPKKAGIVPKKHGKGGGSGGQPLRRRYAPPSTASGSRRRVGPIRLTIPTSVAVLTRTARR